MLKITRTPVRCTCPGIYTASGWEPYMDKKNECK